MDQIDICHSIPNGRPGKSVVAVALLNKTIIKFVIAIFLLIGSQC